MTASKFVWIEDTEPGFTVCSHIPSWLDVTARRLGVDGDVRRIVRRAQDFAAHPQPGRSPSVEARSWVAAADAYVRAVVSESFDMERK